LPGTSASSRQDGARARAVREPGPGLGLFLAGGALIGAGASAVFKGTTGLVLQASPPESRVAMTSALLIALYVGLSVLVIGAGIALTLGASAPDTVPGFAILVRRCRLGLGTAATPALSLGASRSEPIWFSLHPATSCQ